jgi:homoserine O-acetyltransferase
MIREENYYANLVQNRKIATIPTFTLESGLTLTQVPVAYTTWGRLNAAGNNVLVVCHAFTGSSDASDWWRPLMGPGKAIDYTRYFVFCANTLGSPYGSASPLSINPSTQRQYGPEFPRTTIRDDVRCVRYSPKIDKACD